MSKGQCRRCRGKLGGGLPAVDSVEALLHALRGQYEQYFLGMEKRPPSKAHEQFKKQLATLRTIPSRNSALSFRIQSLQATAATYERLWMRTLQEMEDGTYKRDVFKARLRRKSSPESPAKPPPASTEASGRDTRDEAGQDREDRGGPGDIGPVSAARGAY